MLLLNANSAWEMIVGLDRSWSSWSEYGRIWGGREELVVAFFAGRIGPLLYEMEPSAFITPPTGIPKESEASLPEVKSTR